MPLTESTEVMLRMPSGFDSLPTDDSDFFLMRASKPLLENIKKIKIGSCEVFEVCELFEVPHPNFEDFEKFANRFFTSKIHIVSVCPKCRFTPFCREPTHARHKK